MNRSTPRPKTARLLAMLWLAANISTAVSGLAQDSGGISDSARKQIAEILAVKDSMSPAEQKLSSSLAFASRRTRGLPAGPIAGELRSLNAGMVDVEIKGRVSDR